MGVQFLGEESIDFTEEMSFQGLHKKDRVGDRRMGESLEKS